MNRLLRITRLLTLFGGIGAFTAGCTENPTGDLAPQSTCRIQTYTAVTKATFYESTSQTAYSHDGSGNLVGITSTAEKRTLPGRTVSQTGTKTSTYTYDPAGLLTASRTDELYLTIMPDKTIREPITTTATYAYTAGRLTTYTVKRMGAYGLATTTTSTLTYDAAGDLLTRTDTDKTEVYDPTIAKELPTGSGSVSRIWTYQKNVLVDYTEKSGMTETHPLTIQNGLITKITGVNFEVRYTYDSKGRMTRQENFGNGEMTDYTLQTWTDAKSSLAALPVPKGIPTVMAVFGSAQTGVLASQTQFYRNPIKNTQEEYQTASSVVQTNVQGFVSGAITTAKHPYSSSQDYTTTETYVYTGCP